MLRQSDNKLTYCTSKNFEARQDHFVCSTSRLNGKEVCPTHFIRAVVLEQGVLAHLRLVISCVAHHEEQFRKAMGAKQKADAKKELAAKRRNGIAKATPFPENILMLFYECRPQDSSFYVSVSVRHAYFCCL